MAPNDIGWDQWGQHILEELKRINNGVDRLDLRLAALERKVSALEVKAGVWGALGGIAVVGIPLLITVVKG